MPLVLVAAAAPRARAGMRSALEAEGFDVLEADDGLSAVRAALRSRPDAVVLGPLSPTLPARAAARLLEHEPTTVELAVVVAEDPPARDPRQVVAAVRHGLLAADERRGGRPPYRFSAIELDDDEVLARAVRIISGAGGQPGARPGHAD